MSLSVGGLVAASSFALALWAERKLTPEQIAKVQERATRGIRNRNPGNVRPVALPDRWVGQIGIDDAGFSIFQYPWQGIRAMSIVIAGGIKRQGENTLAKIIQNYAPAWDGNPEEQYVEFLSDYTGLGPYQLIPDSKIRQVIFGIARFEGQPLDENYSQAEIDQGIHSAFLKEGVAYV